MADVMRSSTPVTGPVDRADAPGAGGLRGSSRVRAIVDLLNPALPVWDLCCDHGFIGRAALEQYSDTRAVFVDRAAQTVRALAESLGRSSRLAGRYRLVCADALHMELPAAPVNFVIAGVSSIVICRFLEGVTGRRGDRIVCNTFQDPELFEARVRTLRLGIHTSLDVATRRGVQRLWRLETLSGR
jgi:hypothetical protein